MAEVRLLERADRYRRETRSPDYVCRVGVVGTFCELLTLVCDHLLEGKQLNADALFTLDENDGTYDPGLRHLRDYLSGASNRAGGEPQTVDSLELVRQVAESRRRVYWNWRSMGWSLEEALPPVIELSRLLPPDATDDDAAPSLTALEEGIVRGRSGHFRQVVGWLTEFSARRAKGHLQGSALLYLCDPDRVGSAGEEYDVTLNWTGEMVRLMQEAAMDAVRSPLRVGEVNPGQQSDTADESPSPTPQPSSSHPRPKPGHLGVGERPPSTSFYDDPVLEGSKTAIVKVLHAAKVAKSSNRKQLDILAKDKKIMIVGRDGGHKWRVYLGKEVDPDKVLEHALKCKKVVVHPAD